jgi:flagellar hook-length control protein FliK
VTARPAGTAAPAGTAPTAGATPPAPPALATPPGRPAAQTAAAPPSADPAQAALRATSDPPVAAPAVTAVAPDPSASGTIAAAAAPSTPAAPATTAQAHVPINLAQTIEAVRATVELATRQGAARARIQLNPASLGSIRIHLTRTGDGLIARVIAERPEAAQALQQNGADLRRSLEATGLPLLRLDIEASDQRRPGAQNLNQPNSRRAPQGQTEPDGPAITDPGVTPELPGRSLVNVLA